MSVLIPGMEMPQTGLYFVSVDSSNGQDKTVITVERMLGNRDVRQIVGSFELVPVPPHGRLCDLDALLKWARERDDGGPVNWVDSLDLTIWADLHTIIPPEEGET